MEKNQIDLSQMSFEEALRELEMIVRQLEEGKINLEEAISSYEQGVRLKSYCETKLRDARTRVDQIILKTDGQLTTQPFEKIPE
ncbi:MAG: exodeoxyribonuclease VII small subunit [Alphaproteobacteria bacterium]|nr:exodeoxyribonuclease VII small subunit [Alphaproteobacteria bacterium]